MAQCRILLADDEPEIRSFLQKILTARNYAVAEAADGVEALDVLRRKESQVDLLITDIKMPRMDGVELARAVSALFPTMPVLFISGWADPLEKPEWQKPEYAFLRKPFLPNALVKSIEELLARSAVKCAAGQDSQTRSRP